MPFILRDLILPIHPHRLGSPSFNSPMEVS